MCFLSEFPFSSACRGKGLQDVQNSSFKLQRALFALLVEEKAFSMKIVYFCSTSLFPLPVEETARETPKTRVLSHAIAFSLCLSRKSGEGLVDVFWEPLAFPGEGFGRARDGLFALPEREKANAKWQQRFHV